MKARPFNIRTLRAGDFLMRVYRAGEACDDTGPRRVDFVEVTPQGRFVHLSGGVTVCHAIARSDWARCCHDHGEPIRGEWPEEPPAPDTSNSTNDDVEDWTPEPRSFRKRQTVHWWDR